MNTNEILIRGVNAVLPDKIESETDLLIRDGSIQAIGKNLSSDGICPDCQESIKG